MRGDPWFLGFPCRGSQRSGWRRMTGKHGPSDDNLLHVIAATEKELEAKVAQAKVDAQRIVEEAQRSEEHTSELQSQSNLVCRLLLEKKKHNMTVSIYSHPFVGRLLLLYITTTLPHLLVSPTLYPSYLSHPRPTFISIDRCPVMYDDD